MKERLHKYMAKCGVASRRKCEEIVFSGRVKVNGVAVNEIVLVDEIDLVEVDDKPIRLEETKVYILINKPTEIITSVKDQFNRKTVIDLINVKERIFPVGRLDYDTSGALLLTNDGDLAFRMTHPSREIDKVYVAEIIGKPTSNEIERFEKGLEIEDYITSASLIKILAEHKDICQVMITIHEGRNRQVRKMCEKIGHPVIKLKRIGFGKLNVNELEPGEWRYLNQEEIGYLKTI